MPHKVLIFNPHAQDYFVRLKRQFPAIEFHGAATPDEAKDFIAATDVIIALAFFGSLQALVYFLLYKGFGKGQVSVLSPTFASFSGFVALASMAYRGWECLPDRVCLWIAVVALAR